ncbi:O-antigen polymerase [Lactiplantibacillus herbarum]|uniref:O-antigen polymerase n=1 Tax=Lactiplantibacillus herbarum TaxID=1670446 RepID=UPI00064F412A|nr:O-antigen polymerase [Lactiplantibacillus herbarum]
MKIITIIILLILLLMNSYVFKNDVVAPAFIFILTFIISFLDMLLNLSIWKTTITYQTMLVVIIGAIAFSFTSIVIHILYSGLKDDNMAVNAETKFTPEIQIKKWKSVLFLIFQIIVILLVIHSVKRLTAPYGTNGSLSSAISMYQHLIKFTTLSLAFPKLVTYAYVLSSASCFVWGYVIIYNFYFFKKVDFFVVLNLVASLVGSFFTGSRGVAVQAIMSLLVVYVMLHRDGTKKVNMKKVLLIPMSALLVILLSFKYFAALLGRDHSLGLFEYISVYLGAPIKNLDTFLQSSMGTTNPVWGYNTLTMQWQWIGKFLGLNIPKATINTDFLYSNGHNLGNVYTAYKDYIVDFGYFGAIVCIILMAVVMGMLYEKTYGLNRNTSVFKIEWMKLVYGYLLFSTAFTFFSNKFYQAFTVTFFQRVFCWMLLGYFFCDLIKREERKC